MSLLRGGLKLDALVAGANGVVYLLAAGPLGELLGLAPGLLRGAGAFLVAFAVAVWVAGAREDISRTAVAAIVGANALWALGSLVAAGAGWGSPEAVGTVWIVAQALVVGAFAELQLTGMRREPPRAGRERGVASTA